MNEAIRKAGECITAAALAIAASCPPGGDGPGPTPTPTPTPTPPPPAQECRLRPVIAACCDDPNTPDEDEGYARGWPIATPEFIDRVADESGGCLSGIVLRTGPYAEGVGGDYPQYRDTTPPDWTLLSETVRRANARGMQGVVDIWDAWAIKVPSRNPLGLRCADMRDGAPELYLEHARQVAAATCGAGLSVRFELGNEAFLCLPGPGWEQSGINAIRSVSGCENVPIGSNARTGIAFPGFYLTSHGWPPDFEPPLPAGGHWTESDQRPISTRDAAEESITARAFEPHSVESWMAAMTTLWVQQQVTSTIWPGESSEASLTALLEALPGPPAGPGGQPPGCAADGDWLPSCSDGGEDVFGAAVDGAIERVRGTGRWPSPVPESEFVAYTTALADDLQRQGLCATWGAPPHDGRKGSEDEVAVWAPGGGIREQHDVLLGAGEVPWRHLAASCSLR